VREDAKSKQKRKLVFAFLPFFDFGESQIHHKIMESRRILASKLISGCFCNTTQVHCSMRIVSIAPDKSRWRFI
jgi:hypothetical protein